MKYTVKKIAGLIITLLIVSMLAFLAFELIPGDPARSILGTEATESKVQALREEMGLNRPLPQRYGQWVKDFVTGDMGTSYSYQEPVKDLIADKLPVTFYNDGDSVLYLFCFFSIPIGMLSVHYENRWIDKLFLIGNQVTMSIPPFFVGMIFTVIFGLTLRLFVPGGYISYTENVSGFLGYLIFPSLALALPKAAMTAKMFRNALLSEMHKDYIRTAKSRGNGPWRILICHAFRNGILPVITFLGMAAADLIANSIVIEQVFGIPGLGRTLISSISNRDYPVVEAVIVLIAAVILILNTVVDLLYRALDKRIVL